MNALESEYSFLAPTWKLPSVATSSIYSKTAGTGFVPPSNALQSDWGNLTGPSYTSRYVPSYVPLSNVRRNYPINYGSFQGPTFSSQTTSNYQNNNENDQSRSIHGSDDGLNLTISVHPSNEPPTTNRPNVNQNRTFHFSNNDSQNYSTSNNNNQRRRVQIVDQNRQTPSTTINDYAYGKNSRNSNVTPTFSQQNRTPDPPIGQTKYSTTTNSQNNNSISIPAPTSHSYGRRDQSDEARHNHNGSVHEYLYGLSNPDSGSYVNAYRNHQRRLNEEKLGRKSVMNDYKSFAQNGGFGPVFGSTDHYSNIDRSNIEKKRRDYAKVVKETNQQKLEEQKRTRGFSRQTGNRPAPVPKSQRAREYAETIERPHHLRPVMRLRDPNSGNVIVRDSGYDYDPRFD